MEQRYVGGCLCGAVRYEARGAPDKPCYCHCNSCRRAAGAPLVPWATFARSVFRVTHGALSQYRSSPPVTRGFCAACGSSLTYAHASRPEEIDVTLATLDEPALVAPAVHVWVADKLPWVTIGDGLPQYARGFEGGPLP
jgi:hypothetical protein